MEWVQDDDNNVYVQVNTDDKKHNSILRDKLSDFKGNINDKINDYTNNIKNSNVKALFKDNRIVIAMLCMIMPFMVPLQTPVFGNSFTDAAHLTAVVRLPLTLLGQTVINEMCLVISNITNIWGIYKIMNIITDAYNNGTLDGIIYLSNFVYEVLKYKFTAGVDNVLSIGKTYYKKLKRELYRIISQNYGDNMLSENIHDIILSGEDLADLPNPAPDNVLLGLLKYIEKRITSILIMECSIF
jgi:hypothetical protein